MSDKPYDAYRFFLKDTIRQQVDFARTEQSLNVTPPPPQKPCPEESVRVSLPDGATALARLGRMPLGEAISRRESVRSFTQTPLAIDELSALLWATQGVRLVLSRACALRTVPSAGARHAFETYLAVERVDALPPGLYRYLPFDHQLVRLTTDAHIGQAAAAACLQQEFVAEAAVTFFWTALPRLLGPERGGGPDDQGLRRHQFVAEVPDASRGLAPETRDLLPDVGERRGDLVDRGDEDADGKLRGHASPGGESLLALDHPPAEFVRGQCLDFRGGPVEVQREPEPAAPPVERPIPAKGPIATVRFLMSSFDSSRTASGPISLPSGVR